MKAITFNPADDRFNLADIDLPGMEPNDVLVQVEACGLNPVDAKIILWKTMAPGMSNTWVPGLDVAGRVVEVGDSVEGWQVGDRVLYHGNMFRPHGGFAEFAIQNASTLIPMPDLPASLAAATPCAGWTAWRALNDKLHAENHDSILIAGGSGGVGGFAIQLAHYFRLSTIIATCSPRNRDYVLSLGATHVIDYTSEPVVERVKDITNGIGVNISLDCVGGENDIAVANSLAFEGQMVELVAAVRPAEYDNAFAKGLTFHQLSLGSGHRHGPKGISDLVQAGEAFTQLLKEGVVKVPKLETVGFDEAVEALPHMLKQKTVGKIVLEP